MNPGDDLNLITVVSKKLNRYFHSDGVAEIYLEIVPHFGHNDPFQVCLTAAIRRGL